ncbi:MAG: hypothetical protein M9930_10915 [Anaerolineae bacterium]|nr:hypothetical protein [Anaerolineae bacterium]
MSQSRILIAILLLFLTLAACSNTDKPAQEKTELSTTIPTIQPTPTVIQPPAPGTLVVVPEAKRGPINPYIVGSNYGPWTAVPAGMLDAAFDSGIKVVRFPGGAWGDRNELKPYQIDAFFNFVNQIGPDGAGVTINVNLRDGTPEQAAELVRYVNIEKEYGVEYWAIGNEPTLFAAELEIAGRADDYDTEQFNREFRVFAEAMRAVDPSIKLIGPELHQFGPVENSNPKDSAGRDWMIEFLKANGDIVDVVSFHRYPLPGSNPNGVFTFEDLQRQSYEWEHTFAYLNALIAEYTGRDIPIAITEVNSYWSPATQGEVTPDSHYAAIWFAELLGQAIDSDLFMVNHWLLAQAGTGHGMIDRSDVRPSYHVFQLFRRFGSEQVYAESGVEGLSVYAAQREDGALTVVVINLNNEAQTVPLLLPDGISRQAALWRLDMANDPDSAEIITIPDGDTLTFPAQSVSLLIFE